MGGKPVNGSLTIPGIIQYNGQTYRVTSIAAKAFADQYLGAKLSLAEGLLSIGESAFAGCMALKGDITIPDSVISMGESAFDGAYVSSAYVLTLGKGLTALPRKAFANIWGWGIKGIIFAAHSTPTSRRTLFRTAIFMKPLCRSRCTEHMALWMRCSQGR